MNDHSKTPNETGSDLERPDAILSFDVSDEELEAAAANPMVTYGSFGGWLSSTPQCCSMGRC
jgi:hypothetical protein